jgi:hypothetical protein
MKIRTTVWSQNLKILKFFDLRMKMDDGLWLVMSKVDLAARPKPIPRLSLQNQSQTRLTLLKCCRLAIFIVIKKNVPRKTYLVLIE